MRNTNYDKSYGSYYDRGSADSWYSRSKNPHRFGVGVGGRIEATEPEDIEAYLAGYEDNENFGDKKEY